MQEEKMKVSIYNLNMEKVYSICDEPLKILEIDSDSMTISIEILANEILVRENILEIDGRLHNLSINDYQYIKVE